MRAALVSTILALAAGTLAIPALAAEPPAPPPAPPPPPESIEVMVLGTWHFANPGLDLNNVKAEDVLTPRRQAELDAVAAALAEFRPTKIVVERLSADPALTDPNYARFDPAMLAAQRDERVQIGYRLASRLGHRTVYAIDEQPSDGEPDYFPFGKVMDYAQGHGQAGTIAAMMAVPAAEMKAFEALQPTQSLGELLAGYNRREGFNGSIAGYYGLLQFGDTAQQPGAELNAMWYMRNAKIFAKLMTVAQPGDRVLVIYGAGHNYWLRHFASETAGFVNVDPVPYLERAAVPTK